MAPLLSPHDPNHAQVALRLLPPSTEYPLGTDHLGRDLLSRLLYGGRLSLLAAVCVIGGSVLVGIPLGTAAGFVGGRVDRWLTALLLALTTLLTACAGAQPPASSGAPVSAPQSKAPAARKDLRIAVAFGTKTLDPVKATVVPMRFGMAEALFRIDPAGKVVPWLAAGHEQVDERTWKINLRPNLTFNDGAPVDAEAVKASLERSLKEAATAPGLLRSERIEARDGALIIVTAKPHPALLNNLAHPVFSMVKATAAGDAGFAQKPVLTGPYRVREFTPDQSVVLERNPHYWGAAPALERVSIRFLADPNTRVMALQSGEVDLAQDIPAETVATLAQSADLQVDSTVGARVNLIHFNTAKAPFDDVNVRRAVSLAIDRSALAQGVMMDHASPATGIFPSSFPYGGIASDDTGYKVDEARKLLDEAGWMPGPGGVRSKHGKPLSVTLLSYPQRPELNVMAEAVQSYLKEIGMDVKVQVVQDINAELEKKRYDFSMWNQLTAPTADPLFLFDSFLKSTGFTNYMGYKSAEFDGLIERLAVTFDPAVRNELTVEAQRLLIKESPITTLVYQKMTVARSKHLQGFTVHPIDYYLVTESLTW